MPDAIEKVCNTCNISSPLSNFHKDKSIEGGHRHRCKSCIALYSAKYFEKNKERIAEYREKNKENKTLWRVGYYQKNKEQIDLYNTQYREKNKESRVLWRAEYYQKYKERWNLQSVEYRKKHPEVGKATIHKRRALKKKAGGSFTPEQIIQQDKRQKNKCYYCKKEMGSKKTIEHVIPLSRGGSNDMSNIVLACGKCNTSKNDKLPHEWPQGGRLI